MHLKKKKLCHIFRPFEFGEKMEGKRFQKITRICLLEKKTAAAT